MAASRIDGRDVLLYLVAGQEDVSIAAVFITQPDGTPWCWYNRWFIRGSTLGFLELWALRKLGGGRRFAVLTPDDLKGISG